MEASNERPDFSFAKALVVDDMPSNLVMAAGMLKRYKLQADCVTSGEEALERIKSGEPAYRVVFMDHLMPGMDGMETVRRIRALDSEYAKNLPVIAMTGEDGAGSAEMFLENGFQVFIAKPLSVAKLDPVLKEWIRR